MRIVSLLPSATEIVCSLGLRSSLVGVSHECDFPADVVGIPQITQTRIPVDASSREIDALVRDEVSTPSLYSLDVAALIALRPDLIVTQSLCDVCAVPDRDVERVVGSLPKCVETVRLEPTSLAGVLDSIGTVATAAGVEAKGRQVRQELEERIDAVSERSLHCERRPSVMLLEWIDPPFSAGHWNPELVQRAGGRECVGEVGERSRVVEWGAVCRADPERLFIACCGYSVERILRDMPIVRSFPGWNELTCVRQKQVYVADGSAYFSRPGPRLVDSLEILANAIHPTIHPLPNGLPAALSVIA
jgi:iron complex transport system substrate-binding protein